MIYELYGIPGSGKTTAINKYKRTKDLPSKLIRVLKNSILYLIKKVVIYMPSSIFYKWKLNKIIDGKNRTPKFISASIYKNINNIVMVAFAYKYIKNDMYMDEGVLHRIMTFSINYDISIEDTFRMIDVFAGVMKNVKSFYFKASVDQCFCSIKKRNRHENEMDELDDEKLLIFLKKYELYSEAICKKYNHTIVTRETIEVLKD